MNLSRLLFRNLAAKIALLPMIVISLTVFVGCVIYSIVFSFTNSKLVPVFDFIGWFQYVRLFKSRKWDVAVENIFIFGFIFTIGCLILGFLLAVFIDQKVRNESLFRTIFLYPYAMSFIVTGLVWKWVMNPTFGLEHAVHMWGWESFVFDWLVNRDLAIYAVCISAVWQGSGFVMVLMLAGLRGIDEDIWKAIAVDGIPKWRAYISVIIPMIRPVIVTSVVLIAAGVVKVYDLILALTGGGPGYSTTTPAMYVMEHFFNRANVAQSFAAATIMFISVIVILAPWAYWEFYFRQRKEQN
jgi:glucose/mannose transport system permease protein